MLQFPHLISTQSSNPLGFWVISVFQNLLCPLLFLTGDAGNE
jgi:hypothetical protein